MNEENNGRAIYDLCGRLFPVCRSVTGEGVRETLRIIEDYIASTGYKLNYNEIPSGTQVFDWTVPKEWKVRNAYIEDEHGKKIVDFNKNNLHLMGYSLPMDQVMDLDEMGGYLYTQVDQPDVIPYVTSYYKERSGFCISENQKNSLKTGKYHLYIDCELFDGSLTYADLLIPGKTDDEIMITSYICHPSMANNECSGPALWAELVKYVAGMDSRRFTYRFVLNPETIGSITYLATEGHLEHLRKHLKAGVVLSCVGDDRDYSIIHSKEGDTLADRSLSCILKQRKHTEYSFLRRGSDERQYNAPGIELPVVGFCRSKYGEYPEYHTSADDMSLVSISGFQGAYHVMTEWIDALESNRNYRVTVLGEPQFGKRGLYPTISQKGSYSDVEAMTNFIAYCDGKRDLFGISEIIDVPVRVLIPIMKKLINNGLVEDCAGKEKDYG